MTIWLSPLIGSAAFTAVEDVVGFIAGSVTPLAIAGHMVSDVCAMAPSRWAIGLAAPLAKGPGLMVGRDLRFSLLPGTA